MISVKDTGKCPWFYKTNISQHFLNQFTTMPFGLVNAPATFNRLMRKLFHGTNDVDNFIDDILISTDTLGDHLKVLTEFAYKTLD